MKAHIRICSIVPGRPGTPVLLLALLLLLPSVHLAIASQSFIREAKLTGFNSSTNDLFGNAVAISGDTAVVGAWQDKIGANTLQGSAYVFVRSNSDWLLQQQLVASNGPLAGLRFGYSVAIESNTIAVGAWGDGSYGAVYIYTRTGTNWLLQQKLAPTNTTSVADFGWSVSLSGDTVLIGAPSASSGGSAYVYTRSNGTWAPQAFLTAPVPVLYNKFGYSVTLSSNTALIGCYADTVSGHAEQGSAYVFTRAGTNWTFEAQLSAPDGIANDWFGFSVALSGDTAFCGEHRDTVNFKTQCGSVHVFNRTNSTWGYDTKLLAFDSAANDNFGRAVSLRGDTALIGAPLDDGPPLSGTGVDQGSAYIFFRANGVWGGTQKIIAFDRATSDAFASAVAIDGLTAIVSSHLDDIGTAVNQGSAHIYAVPQCRGCDVQNWAGEILYPPNTNSVGVGASVAILNDTAVVGASALGSPFEGAAFIYTNGPSGWGMAANLFNVHSNSTFGWSVALTKNWVVVGEPGANRVAVYTKTNQLWQLVQEPLAVGLGGAIAVSGDTIAAGCPGQFDSGVDKGAVEIYSWNGTGWLNESRIILTVRTDYDEFGKSVALEGDTLVVGAPKSLGGPERPGSAYVYIRSGTNWVQQQELTAFDAQPPDGFGSSVALLGDTLVVGARLYADTGAAYVYARSGTNFVFQQKLTPPDTGTFGDALSLSCNTLVVGSKFSDVGTNRQQGRAYVYHLVGNNWELTSSLVGEEGGEYDMFGSGVATDGCTIFVGAPHEHLVSDAPSHPGQVYVFTEALGTSVSPIQLVTPRVQTNGSFQFNFTNHPGLGFTTLFSTNVALPLSNWTVLGVPTETSPGQFQFTDPQATNGPRRFYRVRSP